MDEELILNLSTKTWTRDSHGLFDYEAIQVKPHEGYVNDNNVLVRKKMDIKLLRNINDISDEEVLFEAKYSQKNYMLSNKVNSNMILNHSTINELQNKMWYVIKHDVIPEECNNANNIIQQQTLHINNDYFINRDDIIKLGRVKYAINEIHLVDNYINNEQMEIDDIGEKYDVSKLNKNSPPVFNFIYKAQLANNYCEDIICKICYVDTNDILNPLVNICEICSGGIKFSHYECLKRWMKTKLIVKENDRKTVKSYNIKSYNCEICKTPYPFRFSLGEYIYDLIEIDRPRNKNYIILESLNQMKDGNNIKSIQVITLEEQNKIKLGRGHEADVRINDISVSRLHASIIFKNGRICIRDLQSKFGTLALIKRDLPILIEKKIQLQIGRTLLEIEGKSLKECQKKLKNKEKKKIQQPKVSTDEQLLHNIRQLNNLGIYRNLLFNQNIQQQNQRINRHFDKYQH